jgi:predicted small lipoprotein YifL
MSLRFLLVALLALAVLSGCGRRGALEAPDATAVAPAPASAASVTPGSGTSPVVPGAPDEEAVPLEPPPPEEAPRRGFLLDFLL